MTTSSKNDRAIAQYTHEIAQHPLLSRVDEHDLAERFQTTGDPAAAERLVTSNLRFVVKIAHEYRGYGLPLTDLVQEGNIGLMMAVRKFEPSRGYRLISYAVWWVRAYIQNFIMRSHSLVKLGTTQAQRKLFFKLRQAQEQATRAAAGGEVASAAEMAGSLGVPVADLESMTGRLAARDFSLDTEVASGGGRTHLDQVADDLGHSPETTVLAEQERAAVRTRTEAALATLNEKERYIIRNRLMCEEPQTLQQIGEHFSISRERARQIEGNVLRKMRVVLRPLREVAHRPDQAA
jgi:RNA polymerase sigma-32 factor